MSLTKSDIPYLTHSWPVIQGCNGPVDPATGHQKRCSYCYLTRARERYGLSMDPVFRAEHLADPLLRRKPAIIGLLGGDLFDPAFTDEQIAAVYGVMAATPWHTYIVPTKQAARMEAWFEWAGDYRPDPEHRWDPSFLCSYYADHTDQDHEVARSAFWPLPNVWQLVSVIDQATADERIPHLLRTPAAHRAVSIAPMQGPIGFAPGGCQWTEEWIGAGGPRGIEAMILEGQSGPGFVPLDLDWVRLTRDQCQAAGVAFAFKQGSGLHPEHEPLLDGVRWPISGLPWMRRTE